MTARKRALCLLLLGLLLLTGCSGGESAAIEGVTWELVRVQSLEDGAVVYCLPEAQSLWPDAAPLTEEILCTALDGTLRLARGETERTAAYAPLEDGSAGEGTRVYAVEWLDGGSAQAICGFVEEGGERTPTLLLRGQEEVLTFAPKAYTTRRGLPRPLPEKGEFQCQARGLLRRGLEGHLPVRLRARARRGAGRLLLRRLDSQAGRATTACARFSSSSRPRTRRAGRIDPQTSTPLQWSISCCRICAVHPVNVRTRTWKFSLQ